MIEELSSYSSPPAKKPGGYWVLEIGDGVMDRNMVRGNFLDLETATEYLAKYNSPQFVNIRFKPFTDPESL